jgi:translocator protein
VAGWHVLPWRLPRRAHRHLAGGPQAQAAFPSPQGTWYQTLHKAPFNPPDGFFSPIWVLLYFMMAIAGWRVWTKSSSAAGRYALFLFSVQLALNLGWSVLFFGYQMVGLALLEMVVLIFTVILTTLHFWVIDKWAGILFLPYGVWLLFAVLLNGFIFFMN